MERFHNLIEALKAAPAERSFVTAWVDEDEHEEVTFGEFRRRARVRARFLQDRGIGAGDRVVILIPQGIAAMTTFTGAMMLGAVPAILAYPNFKVEPAKYASGLAAAGTTGLQKGVALTHRAVLTQIGHLAQVLQIDGASDRVYSWLPLYHDMGLIACFMLPLVCHVPVVMQSPLDWVMRPDNMLQVISEYRCTLAWLPNFAFQFVPRRVSCERLQSFDLSTMRAFVNCSEPVRGSSMDEFLRVLSTIGLKKFALQSSYAMAENVFAVTQSDVTRRDGPPRIWADSQRFRAEHIVEALPEGTPRAMCFVSSGRLLPNHQVRVVLDNGAPSTDGSVGEILVTSDCLFQGYFNRPDLTAEVLRDGWYHTGDLGFQHDGELYVVGRKKGLLIVGGENLYPQDIEDMAAEHPAIHDGRVIALGLYVSSLGTEDIVVVGEVERDELLADAANIEREIRGRIVAGLGVAVRTIFLKPPKWIVKSTAGKPARAATREKLLREHPELNADS